MTAFLAALAFPILLVTGGNRMAFANWLTVGLSPIRRPENGFMGFVSFQFSDQPGIVRRVPSPSGVHVLCDAIGQWRRLDNNFLATEVQYVASLDVQSRSRAIVRGAIACGDH